MRTLALLAGGVCGLVILIAPSGVLGQAPKPNPTNPSNRAPQTGASSLATATQKVLRAQLERLLADIREQKRPLGDLASDARRLHALCVSYTPLSASDTLVVDAMVWRRLLEGLGEKPPASVPSTLAFLADNPRTASALALALKPQDRAGAVLGTLAELKSERPDVVGDKAGNENLIAALCVVFDVAAPDRAPSSPDAVQRLDYFISSRSQLQMPLNTLPVELLVHVVDGAASVPEMQWALKNYARYQNVGKLYSSIMYDTAAFKYGKEKKVFEGGYTLQNIKKVGGVCLEQAYFASEVGKSVGVPSCMVTGEGADVGHAWVGYLKNVGRSFVWDFSEGRYDDYEDVEGSIIDPQTHEKTSDAFVGLSAGLMNLPKGAYARAAALTDAAERLTLSSVVWPKGEEWGISPGEPVRIGDVSTRLELLREALTLVPAYEPAWRAVVALAKSDKMTSEQKREWAAAAIKMCGRGQADFELWFITPLISTEADAATQQKMWNWAFGEFTHRPDLASRVRFMQAKSLEDAKDNAGAFAIYKDVITRFPNEGRSILHALRRCESLLMVAGKPEASIDLYKDAFGRIKKPQTMSAQFAQSSTYYMVGFRYSELLRKYNKIADSNRIRQQIGYVEPVGNGLSRP
jgi:tetratricopeptide (TPR) repeat protein